MNRNGRIHSRIVEGSRVPMTGKEYRRMRRRARLRALEPNLSSKAIYQHAADHSSFRSYLAQRAKASRERDQGAA